MADIILEVDLKDLSLKVEGQGFQGKRCVEDINELQQLLHMRTETEVKKPEFLALQRQGVPQRR